MGTNPGGMSGTQFKAPLDYYVDACLAMGAKVILTSYTPHGCVEGYEYVYDKTTHTFHGCREDAYDSLGIRVIYEERKDNPDILGFIDIVLTPIMRLMNMSRTMQRTAILTKMQRHRQLLIASATIIITEMRDALSSRAI